MGVVVVVVVASEMASTEHILAVPSCCSVSPAQFGMRRTFLKSPRRGAFSATRARSVAAKPHSGEAITPPNINMTGSAASKKALPQPAAAPNIRPLRTRSKPLRVSLSELPDEVLGTPESNKSIKCAQNSPCCNNEAVVEVPDDSICTDSVSASSTPLRDDCPPIPEPDLATIRGLNADATNDNALHVHVLACHTSTPD